MKFKGAPPKASVHPLVTKLVKLRYAYLVSREDAREYIQLRGWLDVRGLLPPVEELDRLEEEYERTLMKPGDEPTTPSRW